MALAVVPYLNAIPNGFVLDDQLIEKDPRIHAVDVGRIFRTGYWDTMNSDPSGDVYRPLAVLSYAINYGIAGPRPAAFHAVNVVLHAVASVLVLALVGRLFGDAWLAFAAAGLFATHPIHTEAVTSVVGRAEIQAAAFLLIALYLHVRRYSVGRLPPAAWVGIGVASFAMALLSKETAVVGPVLLVLIGILDPREGSRAGGRRAAPIALLYVGVVAVYVAARTAVLGTATVGTNHQPGLLYGEALSVRILTGLDVLRIYAKLLLWPVTLSADYSYRQIEVARAGGPAQMAGLALVVGLAAGFVWAVRRERRPLAFAIGFFAVSYAVVANVVVPIGVLVAERLMYLPSVGFCVGVAWAGMALAARDDDGWRRWAVVGGLLLVVALYGTRTWLRNPDWVDEETLYGATVAAAPNSAQAHYRYGAKLITHDDPASLAAGRDEFIRTLEIRPEHLGAMINLSYAYIHLGDTAHAAETARQGLQRWPGNPKLLSFLLYAQQQQQQLK